MTDEEIEKALKEMMFTLNWGTVERIGAVSTDGSGDNKHGGVSSKMARQGNTYERRHSRNCRKIRWGD